ncbi:MAG: carbohydrate kinase [Leeuwenhoekiella sp.]
MQNALKTICFGEILWDKFPDGKALGGAPLNVALRLLSLGADSSIISRLGTDALAEETWNKLDNYNLNQDLIQTDDDLKTGIVDVTLDDSGAASYIINKPVAWDAIELTDRNAKKVSESDLFIFGSLACRSEKSRTTLYTLIQKADKTVFDVNLRAPHYDLDQVVELIKQADVIKMNDDELEEICKFLDFDMNSLKDGLYYLNEFSKADTICVTRGGEGAILLHEGKYYSSNGYPTKVVDTVGAGDSFLAGLLFTLFSENNPQKALEFGCALGALVAGQKGANARIEKQEILNKISEN